MEVTNSDKRSSLLCYGGIVDIEGFTVKNTLAYYDVQIIIISYYSLHLTTLLFLLR